MVGAIVFGVFACVMALVMESGLLSMAIGATSDRPVGLSLCVPITIMAFGFDGLVQFLLNYSFTGSFTGDGQMFDLGLLIAGPASLIVWTLCISFIGKVRLSQSALAAVVMAFANKFILVGIYVGVAVLAATS